MKTATDIKRILRNHKAALQAKYPIKSLALFGSAARGDMHAESDIDIMVEFNDKIGIRFIDLADEIEHLLGRKVDVVSRKGIKQRYFESIEPDLIYV